MIDVVIAGLGETVVGEHWDVSLRELAYKAMDLAQQDAGGLRPQALYVGNMLAPIVSGQAHIGTLLADFAGLRGIEAQTVEAGGASGGAALRLGYLAVKSGLLDVVMVVGVEKTTDRISADIEAAITTTMDSDYEAIHGLTSAAQGAMLMRRYMVEFGVPRQAFAGFPLVAHANGVGNPNAMFRRAIKSTLYERAGYISTPLNMFDVAPDADGAAALILTRRELLPTEFTHPLVRIIGSSMVTDSLALHDREDPLDFRSVRLSVERACSQAGLAHSEMDFLELFDLFSIYAALTLEAGGFAERGKGWQLAENRNIALDGAIPISTMGGLKARGNPWGATGIYQAIEAVLQLRGSAGENQIPNARRGMIQCLGGPAATAVTHILELVN
ncbi:MAG TPA: thiolase domain-containing protein [Anaerolineae bacterium]|nr:thiolase domain-containing protein [Anaerolineae bacterium]